MWLLVHSCPDSKLGFGFDEGNFLDYFLQWPILDGGLVNVHYLLVLIEVSSNSFLEQSLFDANNISTTLGWATGWFCSDNNYLKINL